MKRQVTAFGMAAIMAVGLVMQPALLAQEGAGFISGTAKREARKPYPEYSVRARDVKQGTVGAVTPLDTEGKFILGQIAPANYLVELLDRKGKVVCTEGPFDLTKQASRADVKIECGNPAAWWLLAAAGAAGITAGIVVSDPVSPAQ